MTKLFNYFILFGATIFIISCQKTNNKDLKSIEKQELAKGIRHDSIFMGIYLGMPQRGFYDLCWDMNKKGIFNEGGGMSVEYMFPKKDTLEAMRMNFYPTFKDSVVVEMPMKFIFTDLDVFNPKYNTDRLAKQVRARMEELYGKGFFIATLEKDKKAYAKVDGNRRVLIKSDRDYEVDVLVTDLTVK